MVGQLQDAGNTTTLAHYLELLSGAGILGGLNKFSGSEVRKRGSSPKLLALNNAFISAHSEFQFNTAREKKDYWGRLVESAIGSYLYNQSIGTKYHLMYWREGVKEVDFVLQYGTKIIAIEIKSGKIKETIPGIESFSNIYKPFKKLMVGDGGIPIKNFLLMDIEDLFT
jgi:predicted AAA+ superfamily ATPase